MQIGLIECHAGVAESSVAFIDLAATENTQFNRHKSPCFGRLAVTRRSPVGARAPPRPTVEAPPVVITVSNELPATGENLLAEITAFLLLAGCGVGLRRRFRNA